MAEVLADDPETSAKLTAPMASSPSALASGSSSEPEIPFRAFVRDPAVQALCFTHFVNNW